MIQVEFSIPIRSAMVIRVLTISNLFCFYFIWGEMITEAHFNLVTQLKKLVNSISQPLGLYKVFKQTKLLCPTKLKLNLHLNLQHKNNFALNYKVFPFLRVTGSWQGHSGALLEVIWKPTITIVLL